MLKNLQYSFNSSIFKLFKFICLIALNNSDLFLFEQVIFIFFA